MKYDQLGRSMVEMLGVLAIVGVLSVVAVMGIHAVYLHHPKPLMVYASNLCR